MKRALAAGCVGALITAVAATGCTVGVSGPAGPTASEGAEVAGGQGRRLTDDERILLQRAEAVLVKKCMERHGFKYWVGPLPTADELKGGGYVLTDVGWAKRHGYGSRLQERLKDAQRRDPNHAYADSLPEKERIRYGKALEGGPSAGMLTAELPGGGTVRTPRESCQTDAKERLYGDFDRWFKAEKTATNLTSVYVTDLLRDRRFVGAVEKWAACMRDAGHAYADPPAVREALPRLTEGLDADRAFATEVRLAVAEATCATETPLAETARALDGEYREKRLTEYADDIAAYERMSLAALARAEDVTGSTA
ncbi:hypothetical protein CJD44_36125 [Streptomyces sp. alain-838]|nr:hypothetical protein [Streptomyces sp. alain-838]PAK22325.1 hypothetical protein CJD44_36125 [Streptomyces sp. alain-838]